MITIPVSAIKDARKLLTRLRFERLKLPILNHVLVTIDHAGVSLAVTDLDHWLETRLPGTVYSHELQRHLIPAQAFAAAARGDKGSLVQFDFVENGESSVLTLSVMCGRIPVETVYQTGDVNDFPVRPSIQGGVTTIPKETLLALKKVAACASTDANRHVLNGVLFSPENGGILIATDGRRLAGAPARVTGKAFVVPNQAVHVLGHPDITSRDAAILQDDGVANAPVQFRSGPHTLIAKPIEERYPDFQKVIPRDVPVAVTFDECRRIALVTWLRSLRGAVNSVRLTWETASHVTLTHRESGQVAGTIQVPVTIQGRAPVISFDPKYLADALNIGRTLRLGDGLNLGLAEDGQGNFCLLMCRREAVEEVSTTSVGSSVAIAV